VRGKCAVEVGQPRAIFSAVVLASFARSPLGVSGQYHHRFVTDAGFPLTPTLSLEERE